MKHTLYVASAGLGLLLTACASNRQAAVLEPVGPAPFEQARHETKGELLVYSAFEPGMTSDMDTGTAHHSDYWIKLADGERLKYVNNYVGAFTEEPAVVALAPGHYTVVARVANSGMVSVPVSIEAGKTTAVHLDEIKFEQPHSTGGRDMVHLPDGTIIGWSARS